MMWIGGGAGMAPLRAQIMHLTKTLHTTDRKDVLLLRCPCAERSVLSGRFPANRKGLPNLTFHLALDRPDPAADAAGVKYTPGFVHNVIYETYLKNHEAPEDIEYYMWSWSDVESCREDARRSWRSGTEPDVRQLRRIIRRREQTGRKNDRKGYDKHRAGNLKSSNASSISRFFLVLSHNVFPLWFVSILCLF